MHVNMTVLQENMHTRNTELAHYMWVCKRCCTLPATIWSSRSSFGDCFLDVDGPPSFDPNSASAY